MIICPYDCIILPKSHIARPTLSIGMNNVGYNTIIIMYIL